MERKKNYKLPNVWIGHVWIKLFTPDDVFVQNGASWRISVFSVFVCTKNAWGNFCTWRRCLPWVNSLFRGRQSDERMWRQKLPRLVDGIICEVGVLKIRRNENIMGPVLKCVVVFFYALACMPLQAVSVMLMRSFYKAYVTCKPSSNNSIRGRYKRSL